MKAWIEDELYALIRENMAIPTVDAVVTRGKKVLLLRRNNPPAKGQWWVPGGRILRGESLEDAVLHQVFSETGLHGKIVRRVGVINQIFPEVHTVTVFFVISVETNQVKLNPEHDAYIWVSEIPEGLHPYMQRMLKESRVFQI